MESSTPSSPRVAPSVAPRYLPAMCDVASGWERLDKKLPPPPVNRVTAAARMLPRTPTNTLPADELLSLGRVAKSSRKTSEFTYPDGTSTQNLPARIWVVAPAEIYPQARTRAQRHSRSSNRPAQKQLAVEAEQSSIKQRLSELKHKGIDTVYDSAYRLAAELCTRDDPHTPLTTMEFGAVITAAMTLIAARIESEKKEELGGEVNQYPWIRVDDIAQLCAEEDISRQQIDHVLASLITEGLADGALEPDWDIVPSPLLPVVRILAVPTMVKEKQDPCVKCAIV